MRNGLQVLAVSLAIGVMSVNTMVAGAAVIPDSGRRTISTTDEGIVPYWSDAADVSCSIFEDGGYVNYEVEVLAEETTTKISGNMYLEKYNSGKWMRVKSWGISGKGHKKLSKRYKGVAGVEYRVRVVVKVGTDQIEEVSDSCVV